ncbi:MAG: thiamine-binding protein, partial [Aquificota bacterium]
MAVAEVTVVPLGTGSPSLSVYVAKALKILEQSGLKYQLTPMGTIIEGDPKE